MGSKNSTNRTAAQTETAYFWADGNTTSAISGHFNQIAQKVIPANTPLIDVARVFAQANVASFDASVAGWVVKYKYLNWRPVTAIRQGDGSPANAAYGTPHGRPNWQPPRTRNMLPATSTLRLPLPRCWPPSSAPMLSALL